MAEFSGKRSYLKKIMGYNKGRKEMEVGTLLLGNDKNKVIVNYSLSYFLCLSFWDYMAIQRAI